MPTPVTDPDLLQQLEGGGATSLKPVTDPDLLQQLEAPDGGFFGKVGRFARNVVANPPPTIAGIRDVIQGAPAAATELTWGADPEAARQAAGTMTGAAMLGLPVSPGIRAGEGLLARPLTRQAREAPLIAAGAPPPPRPIDAVVEAGARQGVDIPRFMATEGTAVPQVAASIKNVPFAGQPVIRAADRVGTQLGEARDALAPNAVTPDIAGESARSGIEGWVRTGSKRPVSALYDNVDRMVDPEVRTPLNHTARTVAEIQAERAQSRIPGTSRAVDRVLPGIQDPAGMNYPGIKGLRTWLGETTPQEMVAQGINPIEAKRLYGAMTQDMRNVIANAGGPHALQAWQEANSLARLTKAQQNALTKLIGARGDVSAEGVFNRLLGYAGSTGRGNLNRLQLARRAMGEQAWGEIGSAFISRLGQAPEGIFSPDRFITAYAKLTPAARNVLFTPAQRAGLEDISIVSNRVRGQITRFANPSGTGRATFGNLVTGGALWADPVSLITGMVGGRLAAHALSQPAVLHAAAQVGRAALRNPLATRRALDNLHAVIGRAGLLVNQGQGDQGASQPQYAGAREYTYAPGEIEDQQAASFNGPQGYPDFHWVNPAGVDAFLARAPLSKNIEDRRGELSDAEAAKARRTRWIEGRAEGGPVDEGEPYLVGERGPELFVPGRDGTINSDVNDAFARAAARTGHRGRQEGAGTRFVEGGYGIPAIYRNLDEGARRALESAGQLQRTGDQYDPAPVVAQALGAVGAPLVGPAIEGSVLGAGAVRRAAIPQVAKAELKAADAPIGRRPPEGGGVYPGIYRDPREIAAEAAAQVAPEHPAMKELFGVTRDDLAEIGQQGRRAGNREPVIATKEKARGSDTAARVINRQNEGRILDAMKEAEKYPEFTKGMDNWYVMDPAFQRMVQLLGPEQAIRDYKRFNTLTSMASPGSEVLTEMNRGTAANMMAARGQFPDFVKYGGMAAENRGADFPAALRDVIGHPYHSTAQAGPMERYLQSGEVNMTAPKVPLYMQASGVPETGFQTKLPVPDAHFARAIGMADARRSANPGVSMKTPEYAPIGPWFREKIAKQAGLEAVPAQARMWGLFSPQTGVDTPIGAPKLELLAQKIWERARALGVDPKKLRDDVLTGKAHANWLIPGVGVPGAAAGVLRRGQDDEGF